MAKNSTIPYASATSGTAAREEITKILRRFGCESVGFMDDFADQSVLLAFPHRGRQVQLRASAKGWAQMYLKENPRGPRRRGPRQDYEAAVLRQGLIAVNSILRDWVKGQVTAVECGILSFEDWTSIFGSERLTGAFLDRLTHHVHILELNGGSYRLKQSKNRRRKGQDPAGDGPPPAEAVDPDTGEVSS